MSSDEDTTVRVAADVKADIEEIQREFYAEHRARISASAVIRRMLDDRKAWRAMGGAAREADRKPVPS